ncbi:MAG: DUF1499 domain-containing protein [Beijerinckiaceae bacterium]
MLRTIRITAYAALATCLLIISTALLTSKEEFLLAAFYEMVFGSPDLGPVDFETFTRSTRPNTALACPAGLCRNAKADFDPGVYNVSEEALRDAFTRHALAQPGVIPVYRHAQPGLPTQDRYVQRSKLMQFPDTIDIRFIALSDNTSTLAIYSRSQIGHSDFGVNLARIRQWTQKSVLAP